MNGVRAFAVALLISVSLFGGLSAAATQSAEPVMSIVTEENTSEYLGPAPEGIERTGQQEPSLDVATAVSANAGEIRTSHLGDSLEREYQTAREEEERRAVTREGTRKVVERVDRLEAREESALQRYNEGEIDDSELLRTVAEIHREAQTLEETVLWLEETANINGMTLTSNRLESQRIRLVRLQSPVRESISSSIAGEQNVRIHVETSGDGIVMSAIDRTNRQSYIREAHDSTARTVNIEDRYDSSISAAFDRIEELYPWVIDNAAATTDARPIGPTDVRIYRFEIVHPHGTIETYLDGGSAEIFHEYQQKNPESVPTTTISETEGDLRLDINTTRAGGPLGVTAIDTTTEEPVDADIEVNGTPVGSTDGERFWTVAPRGQVAVNATHAGETVTVETILQ